VTIIDPPNTPALEPKQEAESADGSAAGGSGNEGGSVAAGGGGGGTQRCVCAPSIAIAPSSPSVIAENSQLHRPHQLKRQSQSRPAPQVATEPKPVIPHQSIHSPNQHQPPNSRCSQSASTNAKPVAPNSLPPQTVQQNNEKLRDLVTAGNQTKARKCK